MVMVAGLAFGQGATNGAISGTVIDQDGSVLPGATVAAIQAETATSYTVTAGGDGGYTIANARVGSYTISAELDGFKKAEQTGVVVRLGETSVIDFRLELAAYAETVTVTGEANQLINPTRTGAASNVGTVEIESLPNIGRSLEEFTRTNPMVVITSNNQDPDAISVAGRSSRYNNIQIDGAVNNDLFGLADTGTPGGQAASTPISLDAIREIAIKIADLDVRSGGFSGGGINAITRSGTNQLQGSAYYFTRDDGLVGDVDLLGDFGEFEEESYGFRLGGPVVQDKVFFFVNGEIEDEKTPTGWSLDGTGGQAFANGDAIEEAQLFRDHLIQRYGFDPGGLGQNIRETPSDKFFGRLDFNLNPSHTLTLRHNYVKAENDINRPGSFSYEWPSETYFFADETNSTVAQLNSVFGSTMFNELRVSFQTIEDVRTGRGGAAFPWIEIERVFDTETGANLGEFEAGTENFSTRNALDQEIFELTDDFTWVRGDHAFIVGTHNELFSFDNLFIQNAFGAYEFASLADFLNDRPARFYQFTVVNPGQAESQKFDVTQIGLYAGDTWQLRDNFTLTYGLRVDVPYFPDEPSRNPLTEQLYGIRTDEMPDGQQLWQPRIGFNWDVMGQGRDQLRGGIGIFAGRAPYVWISNSYARTGIEQRFISATNVPFNPDPANQPVPPGGSVGEFNLIDPDFEFPQVLRVNLAYDRELPWWDLVASVEALHADSQKEIDYRDVNLVPTGQSLPFDGRPTFRRLNPAVSGAYLITNTSEGEQTNASLKLERTSRDGLWGFVAYTWGESKSINDGTSSRAVSNYQFNESLDPNRAEVGTSDFEVEHRFSASLSYRFNRDSRWPTSVSAFYNHQAGRPFSYIYGFQSPSGGINGDNYFDNDLFYVPSGPDDVIITGGTWEQLDAFISQDECLDSHRGGIAPRNCSRAPWTHSLDLHVAQAIPIRNSHVELTFDILNVMNLIDEDSGNFRFVNFSTVEPVSYAGFDPATGKPIYGLQRIVTDPGNNDRFTYHNINSRWRAKLGVRWSF
jgi:hypothetical protein